MGEVKRRMVLASDDGIEIEIPPHLAEVIREAQARDITAAGDVPCLPTSGDSQRGTPRISDLRIQPRLRGPPRQISQVERAACGVDGGGGRGFGGWVVPFSLDIGPASAIDPHAERSRRSDGGAPEVRSSFKRRRKHRSR